MKSFIYGIMLGLLTVVLGVMVVRGFNDVDPLIYGETRLVVEATGYHDTLGMYLHLNDDAYGAKMIDDIRRDVEDIANSKAYLVSNTYDNDSGVTTLKFNTESGWTYVEFIYPDPFTSLFVG